MAYAYGVQEKVCIYSHPTDYGIYSRFAFGAARPLNRPRRPGQSSHVTSHVMLVTALLLIGVRRIRV